MNPKPFPRLKKLFALSENPELKNTQVTKRLGELWHNAKPEDKKKWQDLYSESMRKYQAEIDELMGPKPPKRPRTSFLLFMYVS